jgi:hypothetical protein
MGKLPRAVFVAIAVVGALVACVLCLPGTAWLLMSQYGSPTPRQYLVFALLNVFVAALGSVPGLVALVRYAGPKRPGKGEARE